MHACCCACVFFFFKQKTAYEMRISDWSSDVCSSDLLHAREGGRAIAQLFVEMGAGLGHGRSHQGIVPAVQQVDAGMRQILQGTDLAGGRTPVSLDRTSVV